MTEAIWHYTDAAGDQRGPITDDAIRAGLASGEIPADARFWRYGLQDWVDRAAVAAELGLKIEPTLPPPADPYTAPAAFASARRVDQDDVVYAGFIRRWVALIIDQIIVGVPVSIAFAIGLAAMVPAIESGETAPFVMLGFYAVYFAIAALYYAGQESSGAQATLGKRALGIKVTDADGRRLSFGHALGRWAAASLSYMTFYFGFLMAAFTDRKRALHDIVASTLVVDKWAYTDHPEKQKRDSSGCLIAAVIVLFIGVFVVAVLAAVAIPQYTDYVQRAQVSEAPSLAYTAKVNAAEAVARTGRFPASNAEAGLPEPAAISGTYVDAVTVGNGRIVASFSKQPPHKAHANLAGASLVFTPVIVDGMVQEWSCHSDSIRQRNCPSSCTCQ